jgi:DNA-binding MarR family transcriptional regulator
MTTRPVRRESILPAFDCACATVRRAARLLTQLYDEELRPHIEMPQFALLSALERNPACTQSALARGAGFDKTTMSRNLALMRRKGWIEDVHSDDPRDRRVGITAAGRALLRAAKPGWNRAQKRLSSAMAPEEWEKMWHVLDNLTNAALKARQKKGVR